MHTGLNINRLFKNTRLAPTPSGYLHLGNVLSFVLTVALARKTDAKILLRIDDYDQERVTPHFIQDIFDTLNFLEIPWDIGPKNAHEFAAQYAQKHRLPQYRRVLQQLIDNDQVYACTCTRTEILKVSPDGSYPGTCRNKGISVSTPNSALRVKTPEATELVVQTISGKNKVTDLPASIRDFVVRKKDGAPAYQLCSLVDDLHFDVDLVIRGVDLWPSTLGQLFLSTVLEEPRFSHTTFFHHPLLMDHKGQKMSKSAGATSVYQLRKEGRKPAEIFSMIGRMCGVAKPVINWQGLAEALEANKLFISKQHEAFL